MLGPVSPAKMRPTAIAAATAPSIRPVLRSFDQCTYQRIRHLPPLVGIVWYVWAAGWQTAADSHSVFYTYLPFTPRNEDRNKLTRDTQKKLRALVIVFAALYAPWVIIDFYDLAHKKDPTKLEIFVLSVSAFFYAVYIPRLFIFSFLPSVSVGDQLLFNTIDKEKRKFDAFIEVSNFSWLKVFEVTVYVEEVLSDGRTFVKEIQNSKISQLPPNGNMKCSTTHILIKDYDKNHWRSTTNKMRVTVSFVTRLFNAKGFEMALIEPEKY